MSHNLIVIGGKAPNKFSCEGKGYDKIICADSGYDTALKLGLVPTCVVGDLDSTDLRKELEDKGVKACSHDKDETDTELALQKLYPDDTYDLIGGGGGRIDHVLAIFALFNKYNPPMKWYTFSETMCLVGKELVEFDLKDVNSVSFIPVDLSNTAFVNSEGLVWELRNYEISVHSLSISNRPSAQKVKLVSTEQIFCVINNE